MNHADPKPWKVERLDPSTSCYAEIDSSRYRWPAERVARNAAKDGPGVAYRVLDSKSGIVFWSGRNHAPNPKRCPGCREHHDLTLYHPDECPHAPGYDSLWSEVHASDGPIDGYDY